MLKFIFLTLKELQIETEMTSFHCFLTGLFCVSKLEHFETKGSRFRNKFSSAEAYCERAWLQQSGISYPWKMPKNRE